ncbi:MAG TPA: hypothetical protein VGV92_01565 [Gammaproteobacteria bacterium]|nr:hypothetical protein [Gammaproteobacteria bacterium]
MMNFIRKNRDPYSWSYHNDLIAALGHDLRYHVSLGAGAEFELFLQEFYASSPKQFSPIHFLSASETESQEPMIGVITRDFGMLRVLEHPLAREFVSFIPWVYRETFFAMQRLIKQLGSNKTLPEIYKNIEDIRWVNHKLSRRSMLEEIIQSLSQIKLHEFWEAIPTEIPLEIWLNVVTQKIKALIQGESKSLKLPLPCNENLFIPTVIFWLQLLESVLGHRYRHWKVYWSDQSLLFMNGPHAPCEVILLLEPETASLQDIDQKLMIPKDTEITLMKLLSCWGEVLKG